MTWWPHGDISKPTFFLSYLSISDSDRFSPRFFSYQLWRKPAHVSVWHAPCIVEVKQTALELNVSFETNDRLPRMPYVGLLFIFNSYMHNRLGYDVYWPIRRSRWSHHWLKYLFWWAVENDIHHKVSWLRNRSFSVVKWPHYLKFALHSCSTVRARPLDLILYGTRVIACTVYISPQLCVQVRRGELKPSISFYWACHTQQRVSTSCVDVLLCWVWVSVVSSHCFKQSQLGSSDFVVHSHYRNMVILQEKITHSNMSNNTTNNGTIK